MLKRQPRPRNLPGIGRAAQLLHQLGALRETRGPQRVPFRQKSARRIGYIFAAIGIVKGQAPRR